MPEKLQERLDEKNQVLADLRGDLDELRKSAAENEKLVGDVAEKFKNLAADVSQFLREKDSWRGVEKSQEISQETFDKVRGDLVGEKMELSVPEKVEELRAIQKEFAGKFRQLSAEIRDEVAQQEISSRVEEAVAGLGFLWFLVGDDLRNSIEDAARKKFLEKKSLGFWEKLKLQIFSAVSGENFENLDDVISAELLETDSETWGGAETPDVPESLAGDFSDFSEEAQGEISECVVKMRDADLPDEIQNLTPEEQEEFLRTAAMAQQRGERIFVFAEQYFDRNGERFTVLSEEIAETEELSTEGQEPVQQEAREVFDSSGSSTHVIAVMLRKGFVPTELFMNSRNSRFGKIWDFAEGKWLWRGYKKLGDAITKKLADLFLSEAAVMDRLAAKSVGLDSDVKNAVSALRKELLQISQKIDAGEISTPEDFESASEKYRVLMDENKKLFTPEFQNRMREVGLDVRESDVILDAEWKPMTEARSVEVINEKLDKISQLDAEMEQINQEFTSRVNSLDAEVEEFMKNNPWEKQKIAAFRKQKIAELEKYKIAINEKMRKLQLEGVSAAQWLDAEALRAVKSDMMQEILKNNGGVDGFLEKIDRGVDRVAGSRVGRGAMGLVLAGFTLSLAGDAVSGDREQVGNSAADLGVSLVPGVGGAYDIFSAITGKDFSRGWWSYFNPFSDDFLEGDVLGEGEKLPGRERWTRAGLGVLDLVGTGLAPVTFGWSLALSTGARVAAKSALKVVPKIAKGVRLARTARTTIRTIEKVSTWAYLGVTIGLGVSDIAQETGVADAVEDSAQDQFQESYSPTASESKNTPENPENS